MPTLNIKDPEVYQLASELAERRHTSMTGAVRRALEEALDRETISADERIRRMTEIAKRAAAKDGPWLTHDDLYDERGLPH